MRIGDQAGVWPEPENAFGLSSARLRPSPGGPCGREEGLQTDVERPEVDGLQIMRTMFMAVTSGKKGPSLSSRARGLLA